MVELGISLVPEGRRLFPLLTVEENLMLGAFRSTARARIAANLEFSFEAFPVLGRDDAASSRGRCPGASSRCSRSRGPSCRSPASCSSTSPPSGLAPILVSRVIAKIRELKTERSLTVLMAEQNFNQAIKIADRGYIIVHGDIAFAAASAAELAENEMVKQYYLGV